MAEPGPEQGARSLERFTAMLRRWWLLVLAVVVVSAAVAMAIESSGDEPFIATADVYLTRLDLSAAGSGIPDNNSNQPIERWIETQTQLARVPKVGAEAADAA